MKTAFLAILIAFCFVTGFSQTEFNEKDEIIELTVNPEITFQTIHNFGASDAWSSQYVGNWLDDQKNRIADLLFSLDEKEDGSPKGIGLSCWRFNIGAGSAEQQGNTKIGDPWRRTECFLQPDGNYNWNKQKGQRWFLWAAKARGVDSFLGFVNSPPVWLTKNGRANSDGGNSMNLAEKNLQKFSSFLTEVVKNIKRKDGILFDFISPVNEPQWDWKDGQEGSPWTNAEIARLCRLLGNDLKNAGLETKISITEAGLLTHLFDRGNDSERGFQIKNFFSPDSENYIGDVPNMAHKISGHSYFTVNNDSVLHDARKRIFTELQTIDPTLEFWMSEYCILGGNGVLKGGGRDLGMETALFVANIIHADLTVANASAWQWWLAVSPYDFKDGLVYIDKSETGGNIYDSKLLWALGNWSRFVRPGAKRIAVDSGENQDIKVSAFKNTNGEMIVVVLNRGNNVEKIRMKLPGNLKYDAKIYETSENKSLSKKEDIKLNGPFNIPKQSISTLVIPQ
jgi:O-glycosyl hydrolase